MRKPILAAVAGLLAIVTSTSVAEAAQTPYLPKPTGHYPVGNTSLYLKDTSRPDPWVPEAHARELMVTLWYPALPLDGHRAQYMTPRESELFLADGGITTVPPDILSKTRTNAVSDAKPWGGKHSLPLVVLSPGYTKPRATLSSLAEDLASHGYVVAAIGHTYENAATEFPDGRVVTCASCEVLHDLAFWAKLDAGRAADTSFVLDELTGPHPPWPGARLIDPARIAMAGHSAGGSAAVTTMVTDARVRAGVDIDGTTNTPIPDSGLSRPFLFLGRASQYTPGLPSPVITWERDWRHLTGWKRWLVVDGPVHASFTDVGLLAEQFGIDFGATLSAARTSEITRAYVGAFFDLHLRHDREPLLDKPSQRYPEVAFCDPAA
ncbi:Platelet-activating factor acetylhydrolase, isoform II [Amycolatopsis xylanica]|uniref:Platelet-activating factor acetylhydrolase, isoform II n=1 Tax=Amycolatopsis xylanica TaxID=589385 RepID=A0A1H2S8L3_9PSEU|nr:alpha/beta hydrolase [Amycolatopsis xylanica]SDW27906.1 Platelet-activating factor acetylhydrolase, isoform II [Amycolatopsis xylanica]